MGKADCHIHMVLDGADWRSAIDRHRNGVDRQWVRERLREYAEAGFDYLRDGGDKWGVGAAAREMAYGFGITYKTPLAPLILEGHYGGFLGERYSGLREYAALVKKRREQGADFIKLMISGIMDFDCYGKLSETGLEPELIRELVQIAHAEGFAVMCHANGARTVEAAAVAGAESVEHGAYLDEAALCAMAENGTVWCPTLSAIANLRGTGRFDEGSVSRIVNSAAENLQRFAELGGLIAPGSDAGAWAVAHGTGGLGEYAKLSQILGKDAKKRLEAGAGAIRDRF